MTGGLFSFWLPAQEVDGLDYLVVAGGEDLANDGSTHIVVGYSDNDSESWRAIHAGPYWPAYGLIVLLDNQTGPFSVRFSVVCKRDDKDDYRGETIARFDPSVPKTSECGGKTQVLCLEASSQSRQMKAAVFDHLATLTEEGRFEAPDVQSEFEGFARQLRTGFAGGGRNPNHVLLAPRAEDGRLGPAVDANPDQRPTLELSTSRVADPDVGVMKLIVSLKRAADDASVRPPVLVRYPAKGPLEDEFSRQLQAIGFVRQASIEPIEVEAARIGSDFVYEVLAPGVEEVLVLRGWHGELELPAPLAKSGDATGPLAFSYVGNGHIERVVWGKEKTVVDALSDWYAWIHRTEDAASVKRQQDVRSHESFWSVLDPNLKDQLPMLAPESEVTADRALVRAAGVTGGARTVLTLAVLREVHWLARQLDNDGVEQVQELALSPTPARVSAMRFWAWAMVRWPNLRLQELKSANDLTEVGLAVLNGFSKRETTIGMPAGTAWLAPLMVMTSDRLHDLAVAGELHMRIHWEHLRREDAYALLAEIGKQEWASYRLLQPALGMFLLETFPLPKGDALTLEGFELWWSKAREPFERLRYGLELIATHARAAGAIGLVSLVKFERPGAAPASKVTSMIGRQGKLLKQFVDDGLASGQLDSQWQPAFENAVDAIAAFEKAFETHIARAMAGLRSGGGAFPHRLPDRQIDWLRHSLGDILVQGPPARDITVQRALNAFDDSDGRVVTGDAAFDGQLNVLIDEVSGVLADIITFVQKYRHEGWENLSVVWPEAELGRLAIAVVAMAWWGEMRSQFAELMVPKGDDEVALATFRILHDRLASEHYSYAGGLIDTHIKLRSQVDD